MKIFFYTIIIFLLQANLFSMPIDRESSEINILSHSKIFIDKNSEFSYDEVIKKEFTTNTQKIIGLGIVPNTTLWIKFSLTNSTDKPLNKILEYDNPETEDLYFYDGDKITIDGMFHHSKDRQSINPIFHIRLDAKETRTYYIKAHCKISTLIAKLTLWNEIDFLKHDYKHKTYLFIFFATISTLLIYNFMLFIFTRDKTYLYYVTYLGSMMIFRSIYLGVAQLYFFSNAISVLVTKGTTIYLFIGYTYYFLYKRVFKY